MKDRFIQLRLVSGDCQQIKEAKTWTTDEMSSEICVLCETNQSSISGYFRSVISNPGPRRPLSCRYFSFLRFKHLLWMKGWLASFYRAWGHAEEVIHSLNQKYWGNNQNMQNSCPPRMRNGLHCFDLNAWKWYKTWNSKSTMCSLKVPVDISQGDQEERLVGVTIIWILTWTKPYRKPRVNQTHWFRGIISFQSD